MITAKQLENIPIPASDIPFLSGRVFLNALDPYAPSFQIHLCPPVISPIAPFMNSFDRCTIVILDNVAVIHDAHFKLFLLCFFSCFEHSSDSRRRQSATGFFHKICFPCFSCFLEVNRNGNQRRCGQNHHNPLPLIAALYPSKTCSNFISLLVPDHLESSNIFPWSIYD